MRVKKAANGDKPLSLNVNSEVPQNESNDDTGTPLLFDSTDFVNSELVDMMSYNTMPFFPTSMYQYGDYQGQYPGFPIDPNTYESFMTNPLFSPDGSTVTADEELDTTPSELPIGSRESVIPSPVNKQTVSATVAPNLEKYSLKVKVRHPEKTASIIRGNNKTFESQGVDLGSVIHTEDVNTGNERSNPNTENLQSNIPLQNFGKPTTNKVNHIDDTIGDKNNDNYSSIIATAVPPGSIVLHDGTVLVPTDQQQGNIIAEQKGQASNTVSSAYSYNLDNNSKDGLTRAGEQHTSLSTSLPNQLGNLPVVGGHIINTDISFVQPDISSTSSIDHIEEVVPPLVARNSTLESNSPTSSQIGALSPQKSNLSRKSKALKKEKVSPNMSALVVDSTNKSKKALRKRSITRELEDSINDNTHMLTSKLTPVSKITNIVGTVKNDELEENDILKAAVSKPIKHRTDIRDADSAQERSIKNAINARVNRQKHKVYVQTLEEENNDLKAQLSKLKTNIDVLMQEKDLLNSEVVYLKKVIANQSSLSNVLSGLNNIQDVTLSSSFARQFRKRPADSSQDPETEKKSKLTVQNPQVTGGLCIHVTGSHASLELCQKCAEMAGTSTQ